MAGAKQRANRYDFTWQGGTSRAEADHEDVTYEHAPANPMLDVFSTGMDVFARNNHIYFHAPVSKESVYQVGMIVN